MTCKGTNCTAAPENGYKHSSECLFDHARAVASGVESASFGVDLPDSVEYVMWRGQRIELTAALTPAAASGGERVIVDYNYNGDAVYGTPSDLPAASQPVMGAGSWKVPAGAEHEQVAEFLFRIGWNSPCDAQWHNLRDNLPELAALLAAQEAAK